MYHTRVQWNIPAPRLHCRRTSPIPGCTVGDTQFYDSQPRLYSHAPLCDTQFYDSQPRLYSMHPCVIHSSRQSTSSIFHAPLCDTHTTVNLVYIPCTCVIQFSQSTSHGNIPMHPCVIHSSRQSTSSIFHAPLCDTQS